MKNNLVFLFPGQGSQYIGMNNIPEEFLKISNEIFNKSNEILNYDIKEIIMNGPKEKLNQTIYTQPSIFIQSIIHNKILETKNIIPIAVAGHSLGEFSALACAIT